MKIYLAGPWSARAEAAVWAKRMREDGWEIVSTWHDRPEASKQTKQMVSTTYGEIDLGEMREIALQDLREVGEADAVVVLALAKSEGKATELGYALGKAIPVIVVTFGRPLDNTFYPLAHLAAGYLQMSSALGRLSGALLPPAPNQPQPYMGEADEDEEPDVSPLRYPEEA